MSIETRQSQGTFKNQPELTVSSYQIDSKPWRLEPYFKILSYILYGFFFGMLPASFKFANIPSGINNTIEISGIIAVFGVALVSITLIFWIFKGDVKHYASLGYYLLHIFNAISLVTGLVIIAFFPVGASGLGDAINQLKTVSFRQLVLAAIMIVHVLFLSAGISLFFYKFKKLFPLTWSRIAFAQGTLVLAGFTNSLVWFAAEAEMRNELDNMTMLLFVALMIFALAFILFIFALAYIRIYRDILLGERTDVEIESINNWENAKSLALISSSVAAITFIFASYWDKKFAVTGLIAVEIIFDILLFGTYLSLAIIAKIQERKEIQEPGHNYKFLKIFKSIDNVLFFEVIIWVLLSKAALIEGILITIGEKNSNLSEQVPNLYMIALISFFFVSLMYILGPILSIHIPNIRNMWISIVAICFSVLLIILTIVFTNILTDNTSENPSYLPLYMILTLLIGISISLILRTFMVSQIFQPEHRAKKANHDEDEAHEIHQEIEVPIDEDASSQEAQSFAQTETQDLD